MLTTRLLVCLGILALTTPALSAQFFIVQDSATNRCTITLSQSTPSQSMSVITVLVGDGAYGDRAAAEADMRAIAACLGSR
jgi:hypothetical protein